MALLDCTITHGSNTVQGTNNTTQTLPQGALYAAGSFQGVVQRESLNGALVVFAVNPGLEVEVTTVGSQNIALGDPMYVVTSTGLATKTNPGGSGFLIGYAVPGANLRQGNIVDGDCCCKSTETRCRVRLN